MEPTKTSTIGIVKDDRYLEHKPGHMHPEHPTRLKAVYGMLKQDFPVGLVPVEPKPATLENLELVHSPAYVQKVLKTAHHKFTSLSPDTPASAKTYMAAWLAAGGCIEALDRLMAEELYCCFALVRPPGHHAGPDRAAGFCVFNNVGITARYALKQYGLERILIIDWDVHHGNGVSDLFYEEKKAIYFSSHDLLLYPHTGAWDETGEGEGKGYTINLPLPRGLADNEFLFLYRKILGSVWRAYDPQLVLINAGFDAHGDDPIGRCALTEKVFGALTRLLLDLGDETSRPPMLFVLEGGYHPRALADCVREVLLALTGVKPERDPVPEETEDSAQLVARANGVHKTYGVW